MVACWMRDGSPWRSGAVAAAARRPHGGGWVGADGQPNLSGEGAAIAIHAHSLGRSDAAGPQDKLYLNDGTAFTADSRSSAQAVAYIPRDGRADHEVHKLTPVEQEALQGFPRDYTAVVLGTRKIRRVSSLQELPRDALARQG